MINKKNLLILALICVVLVFLTVSCENNATDSLFPASEKEIQAAKAIIDGFIHCDLEKLKQDSYVAVQTFDSVSRISILKPFYVSNNDKVIVYRAGGNVITYEDGIEFSITASVDGKTYVLAVSQIKYSYLFGTINGHEIMI